MGKYTIYGEKIDFEIQKQLDKIINVIINTINPISIILIGGFGRGEGGIIYKNKKFIPINDYDIYVITSKKYSDKLIEKMCEKASESIDKKCIDFYDYSRDMKYDIEKTFYPDIRVLTLSELKKLPPFLKYFELRNSIVIYGKDIIKKIPDIQIKEIPSPEGFRFLMNRLSLMIMHFPYSAFKKLSQKDRERIINFNSKTALSCAEALLFYSKKFVPSYYKRAKILEKTFKKDFPELFLKIPDLPKIVNKYTNQKLKPNYKLIKSPIEDWFKIRDYGIEIIRYLIYKFTKKKAKNIENLAYILNKTYSKKYLKDYIKVKFKIKNSFLLSILVYPANFVLNLLYIQRIKSTKKRFLFSPLKHPLIPPDLKLFPSTILIISSINKNGEIDYRLFNKSRAYFKQIFFDNQEIYKNKDWEEMRKNFGTAFNIYGFQKLI